MKYVSTFFLLIAPFLICCVSKPKKDNEFVKNDNFNGVAKMVNDRLIDKDCSSILSVIPKDKINNKDFVVKF